MGASKLNATKKTQAAAYDAAKLNAKDVNDLQDAVNNHADHLDAHDELFETLPSGTAAELVLFILSNLPGYDATVAQVVTHDAGGTWRAATLNMSTTGGGTVTPAPVAGQPAILTASKTDLAIKDRNNLTATGTGVDREVRGANGVGWQTGGNTANFAYKPTATVDWLFEVSIRADSVKASFSISPTNDGIINGGYGLNGATSIAVMSDGRLFVNKAGTETYLGVTIPLGSTKTVKLALVGSGSAVTLWYTTDGATYTKVSAFTAANSASIFLGLAEDGPSALYNIQQSGLAIF